MWYKSYKERDCDLFFLQIIFCILEKKIFAPNFQLLLTPFSYTCKPECDYAFSLLDNSLDYKVLKTSQVNQIALQMVENKAFLPIPISQKKQGQGWLCISCDWDFNSWSITSWEELVGIRESNSWLHTGPPKIEVVFLRALSHASWILAGFMLWSWRVQEPMLCLIETWNLLVFDFLKALKSVFMPAVWRMMWKCQSSFLHAEQKRRSRTVIWKDL